MIFAHDAGQKAEAEDSKKKLADSSMLSRPIAVQIKDAAAFWPAEDEHQNFYTKNPFRYRFYRAGCGRDARVAQVWGKQAGH
jgi:peptide-methionine (S)-S-oxide reductase